MSVVAVPEQEELADWLIAFAKSTPPAASASMFGVVSRE
jgi:hypothetical protein